MQKLSAAFWVCAIFLSLTSHVSAAEDGTATSRPDQDLLKKLDDHEAVLANRFVAVTIDIASASISSIEYAGHQMVEATGRHRSIYFSTDGGANYERPEHCRGSIFQHSPDLVDIACQHRFDPARDKHAWDTEVHFVLKRDLPGVYVYVINSHPQSYPRLQIGEWRMVWSTPQSPRDWLSSVFVDDARHWRLPTPADFAKAHAVPGAPKEVTLLTTGSWTGRYDCKYMYAASYWDLGCWGFASDENHQGAWVVFGSHEFFNDGPNKQDLTAAVGTTLVHLNMNHYDGTAFTIEKGNAWEKIYGPWLLYLNHEKTAEDCWHDAQQQARLESQQWPYSWVQQKSYPPAEERGTVKGRLVIQDPLHRQLTAAGAWVGLAAPENGPNSDFQFQSTGYQFWTRADPDGSFKLPAVRPGEYELYAYTTGVVGQFTKREITVQPGAMDLQTLTWAVPHHGSHIAWEIGVPDRSAAEFRHGDDYYLPLLYQKLWTEEANPLEYTVGQSDWHKDWYYAQTRHGSEEHPEPARWRIHFRLPNAPTDPATLTLAFAGAERAKIAIFTNDQPHPLTTVVPPIQGGNGLIREAVHAKYSVSYVTLPPSALRQGDNVIELEQTDTRAASSDVMYDYLSLELP